MLARLLWALSVGFRYFWVSSLHVFSLLHEPCTCDRCFIHIDVQNVYLYMRVSVFMCVNQLSNMMANYLVCFQSMIILPLKKTEISERNYKSTQMYKFGSASDVP